MTMLSIRQTQFMTAKKIAEEQDVRITTIENELRCKHISAEHRCELAKLKRVLNDRTSKSFANIVYASQQQEVKYVEIKHLIDNYKVLAESKKLNPDDVYFVTINCCEGRINKKPYFVAPKDLANFNVRTAKNTIIKQLHGLENACGYVAFEVKYDIRMGAFLPHFHILICGISKKNIEDYFARLYPLEYQFKLNRDTFIISKKNDPLIYERPQKLKIVDIETVKDSEKIASYMCKFKTYMTYMEQRYLTVIVDRDENRIEKEQPKHIRPNDKIHNYHLLFLDKLSLGEQVFCFNKNLLTNFINNKADKMAQKCLRMAKRGKKTGELGKKASKHNTYAKPISTNKIVLQFLKYDFYKPKQEKIIDYIKDHKSCIVIQPTNFGKSLCYYASALQLKGLCVVIEPLVSLIYDQVSKLNKIHKKLALAFTGETKHRDKKLKRLKRGIYKFLYIAPEMLKNIELKKVLSKLDICMIAVDEAHCIDIWGEDFRPDYKEPLNKLIKKYPDAKVMALTATAGDITQNVIKKVCNMPKKAKVFKGNLNRPNIKYSVVKKEYDGLQQLLDTLKPYLDKDNKPTTSIIIYCAHIDYTLGLQDILKERGINSYVFNGKSDNKKEILKKFKKEKCIVLATSAFGMGIDKPSVHLVIHFEGTYNLEMYYQESGRVGRDGENSRAVLFYSDIDIERMTYFAKNDTMKEKLKLAIKYMQMTNNKKRREFLLNSIV